MGLNRKKATTPTCGYVQGFAELFELQRELGKGGNGVVRLARQKATGRLFAVKTIPKVLADPNASERKKAGQIPYLKQEVEVLLALRGTLNVANLEGVYEDDQHVHLVLELCSGGELVGATKGERHYSERTAASFLRAVLRTVAQCHAKRIIHRDIKPENFLLLSEDAAAPLKAIDFGLAVFFDPQQLPVTGLNPEGTPWYLAPESCRAKWYPVSDVWAVGVMACYLLTGSYPFLDRLTPKMPDLARTLRSICFEELDLGRQEFEGLLSPEARAFVEALLVKDPLQRPSAEEALKHPFLKGGASERAAGKPLDKTVVQRIQRFAQSSLFKRTVLEHIAQDLLSMHFSPDATRHGAQVFRDRSIRGGRALAAAERSVHGGGGSGSGDRSFRGLASAALAAVRLERSVHGGREGSMHSRREGSMHSRRERSVHGSGVSGGGGDRSFRGLATAALAAVRMDRSAHGGAGSTHGGAGSTHSRGERSVLSSDRAKLGGGGGGGGGGALALSRAGSIQHDPSMRSASRYLPVATPYSQRLAELLDKLQLSPGQKIDSRKLQESLQKIGYHLQEAEAEELFGVVDVEHKGEVTRAEMAAGLIDWKAFQDTYKDRWLECARRAFADLDASGTGLLNASEIASAFGSHLSPYEVDAAVHHALLEATNGAAGAAAHTAALAAAESGGGAVAAAGGDGDTEQGWGGVRHIDFDNFLCLLRAPSGRGEELDWFDDRLSNHTSRLPSMWADDLPTVKRQQQAGDSGGGSSCCTIS